MKRTNESNRFKRDLRKCVKRGYNADSLFRIVDLLKEGKPLPENAKPHKLKGKYIGWWECKIEPDWLLVYKIEKNILHLYATGKHSDLFKE